MEKDLNLEYRNNRLYTTILMTQHSITIHIFYRNIGGVRENLKQNRKGTAEENVLAIK